jgi:hypothetical protein
LPATICVEDVPTIPVITGVTTILPFSSSVTVELVPRELIAALSTFTAPSACAGDDRRRRRHARVLPASKLRQSSVTS